MTKPLERYLLGSFETTSSQSYQQGLESDGPQATLAAPCYTLETINKQNHLQIYDVYAGVALSMLSYTDLKRLCIHRSAKRGSSLCRSS